MEMKIQNQEITLTVVRHGQSVGNVQDVLQGHMDFELTDLGQEQARLTGMALQDQSFDYACGSDLKRAINTMEAIVDVNKTFNGPFDSSKLLRETNYVCANRFETNDQLKARVDTFMQDLLKNAVENGQRNILLVSHSGTIRIFVNWLYNSCSIDGLTKEMTELGGSPKQWFPSNSSISKFSLNVDIDTKSITSGHCLQLYDNSHITSK